MRELVIFIPSIEGGGVEKNLFYIIEYLKSKFNQIYLVTADKPTREKLNKKIKIISPKSNFFRNKNRLIKSFICTYLTLIYFFNKNALIFSFQSNFFSIVISKIIKSKIIIRLNTSPEKYSTNKFKRIIFRNIYKFADEIIVNSYEFKKNLINHFNLNSKVILNPIKLVKKKKIEINFFRNFQGLKIIAIGRLTDQKDHMTLLKALNLLKTNYKFDFKLYLIGRGYNYNIISNYIKNNNLNKKIKLAGYKKNAFKYIRSSDLLVSTSKYEGLPNTLIEAQASDVPIIASNCPSGPKEILMNGKLGDLFRVGDYKNLSKKILVFYKNKQKLKAKSRLARKYLYRFHYNSNLKKYFEIIRKNIH